MELPRARVQPHDRPRHRRRRALRGSPCPRSRLDGRGVAIEAKSPVAQSSTAAYMEFVFSRKGIKVPDLPHLKTAGRFDPRRCPITTLASRTTVTFSPCRPRARVPWLPVDDAAQWMRFNDHGIASFLQERIRRRRGVVPARSQSLQPDRPDGLSRNLARRWIQSGTPERAASVSGEGRRRRADAIPQRPVLLGPLFSSVSTSSRAPRKAYAGVDGGLPRRTATRGGGSASVRYKLHRYEESRRRRISKVLKHRSRGSARRTSGGVDIYRQLGKDARGRRRRAKALAEVPQRDDEAEEVARGFLQRPRGDQP